MIGLFGYATRQQKKGLNILKHCAPVVGFALSDDHIVTCSYSECEAGELQVFRNKNGYTLVKTLLLQHWVLNPRIPNNDFMEVDQPFVVSM